MSEDEIKIATLSAQLTGLTKTVEDGFKRMEDSMEKSTIHWRAQHTTHFDSATEHGKAIAKLETTVVVLKWVIGIGLSFTAIGMSAVKFIGGNP